MDIITVKGWVRTRRDSKDFSFLEMNDGSCLANIQCIADTGIPGYEDVTKMTTGSAVGITGKLVESPGKGQQWEIHATEIELIGEAPADYPLQKKGHTAEFLRSIAHLRPRANLYGALFRMRSRMAQAAHRFFDERDFTYVHTPIITDSDCEGAGEMFRVTTLDPSQAGAQKFENDFFGKATYLTVSGQLEGEAFATALSNIYTFGPTFRAENSHTSRHASEFWMIEPEMAFCDLKGDMDLAEEFTKYLVDDTLNNNEGDLDIFARFVDKGLLDRLRFVSEKPFQRVSYTEAVEILENSGQKFDYPVSGASTCSQNTSVFSPSNTSNVRSRFIITRKASNLFTCAPTNRTAKADSPSPPWTCWCLASARSSVALSVRSASTFCVPTCRRMI